MNERLLRIIRQVRNRWRLHRALRGLAIVVSAGLVVFLFSAYGMDRLRFTPTAVLLFQILAYGSVLGLAIRYLILPLRRRVTDEQVALYLEEHEPSLDGQLMGAVDSSGSVADQGASHALMERVVERAIQRCSAINDGRRVEQAGLARSGGLLAGATMAALALLLLNPGFVRNSRPFLLAPWSGNGSDNPYAIEVFPGDSTVARGADLRIGASLVNFDAEDVEIVMRGAGADEWERWSMTVDEETGSFTILLFALEDSTEYFVEAGGVRSGVYRLAVTDLPYVDDIGLEYHFPAYTGLSPQRQEDTGDIAALAGTRVVVDVTPTMNVSAGALAVGADTLTLTVGDDAVLSGEIRVRSNGSYRVLLAAPDGRLIAASPEYFIDVLDDQPPAISFSKPGRDMTATSVDEVFTEVRAEDDFGIRAVALVFSVNGGPEDTVDLYGGRGGRKQITAGQTFYLEEYELEPGDLVSYYARARDTRPESKPAITDIYFVTIRPFDRTFRQAEAGGGQQGQGGMGVGELSGRQREIVAATFKLVRDSTDYTEKDFRDNLSTVTLSQGRLREEVETLLQRIQSRGIVQLDSTFATIAAALPEAVTAMEAAEGRLGRREANGALPPEREALRHLQRAEAAFRERQVAQGQQGGGGGQQSGADAEELAELFELELDRMRNQYEQVQRGQRQQADEQVDETLEKLRELARRQEQENERARAQAQRGTPSGGTGRGQRRLADEAEELARRLERLSREQSRPDLEEAARRIQQAADAMRQSAAEGNTSSQGSRALDRLRDARRQLERNRAAGLQQEMEQALQQTDRLRKQQERVTEQAGRLARDPQERRQELERLFERKRQMADEVQDLEAQIDRLSRDARAQQPEAAERLRDAAAGLRDRRVRDKILYSQGVAAERDSTFVRNFEEQIGSDLETLREQLADAIGQLGESREQRLGRALDDTRDVAEALESLRERAEEATEQRQQDQQGQGGREAGGQQQQGQGGQAGGRRLDPNARRQFGRELQERRGELQELRRQFQRDGVDVSQLDDVISAMGRFDNSGAIGDPRGMGQLETEIVQGLKEFEFSLRRQLLGGDADRLFLSGSGEVPTEYREMVEEYYRRLAERRN